MTQTYGEITGHITQGILKLREAAPDPMKAFSALSKEAMKGGEVSELTKELMALAIGVATHCVGCIGFHAKALARLGATRQQVMETLAVTVYMGGGPALMYAAEAVHAFDEFAAQRAARSAPAG
jgi:AhpD family alkylhydroperoxidase